MSAGKKIKYNWSKLKAEYCTTKISIREMAKKYNIPYSTINSRSNKEKWAKIKAETLPKIEQEAEQKIIEKAAEKEINKKIRANELHTELFDKGLDVARMLLDKYMNDLKEGKKRTGATATNLDYLMGAISKAQKGQRMSLNIEAETAVDNEPEIMIIKGVDIDKI